MTREERLKRNHHELERLAAESRKAREAVVLALKTASEKADEFSRYARWCLGVSAEGEREKE